MIKWNDLERNRIFFKTKTKIKKMEVQGSCHLGFII